MELYRPPDQHRSIVEERFDLVLGQDKKVSEKLYERMYQKPINDSFCLKQFTVATNLFSQGGVHPVPIALASQIGSSSNSGGAIDAGVVHIIVTICVIGYPHTSYWVRVEDNLLIHPELCPAVVAAWTKQI